MSTNRKVSHLLPTWQDLDAWHAINDALSPLADFNDIMSGERYVTGSAILPIVNLLSTSILKEKSDDKAMTNEIRAAIISDLSGRYHNSEIVNLLELTLFIDPRFKGKFFDDCDIDDLKDTLYSEAVELFQQSNDHHSIAPLASSTESSQPPAKKVTLATLLKTNEDVSESDSHTRDGIDISPEQTIRSEVSSYLAQPRADMEENPLKWWKSHETVYSLLANVSRKYLSILATSTASE